MADAKKRKVVRSKLTKAQREMLDERAAVLHRVRAFPENEGTRPIDPVHDKLILQARALFDDLKAFSKRPMFRARGNGVLAKSALAAARRAVVELEAIRLPQSNGDE